MSKSRQGSTKERSVFVGNIPYDVSEDQLAQIFSEVGRVLSFRLVTDRETGKPKGYGFCEYSDGATALSAMRNLNGYEVSGRNLRVDFADGGEKDKSGEKRSDNPNVLSGSAAIAAIDEAIGKQGVMPLYDMLVAFQNFGKSAPEHTKTILSAHPALSHALLQCFKLFDVPISTSEKAAPQQPPVQRNTAPPGGGILGEAPILGQAPGPAFNQPQYPPNYGTMPPPMAQMQQPPPMVQPSTTTNQRSRDPRRRGAPAADAPQPVVSKDRSRDPRLKRSADAMQGSAVPMDPRAAKKVAPNAEANVMEELARSMTPAKMQQLSPEDRAVLTEYMTQMGIHIR